MRLVEFMASNKALVSFAIVSTNWKLKKEDPFDTLKPFVLYYLAHDVDNYDNIVSLSDGQSYIKNEFGLTIYLNVLEIVLNRISKDGIVEYNKKSKSYVLKNKKDIHIEQFEEQREHNKESYLKVQQAFYDFLQNKNIQYDNDTASNALISYFCEYGIDVIARNSLDIPKSQLWHFRVGEFVQYIFANNALIEKYIIEIAQGGMISSILFKDETYKKRQQFRNTKIYYDTPLLMHILGYSGKAFQDSAMEMTTLLLNQGAELGCFERNIDELEGILDAYATRYNNHTLSKSYNFEHFITSGVTPRDISEMKAVISSRLRKLKIVVEDFPSYEKYEDNIDWVKFDDHVKTSIHYNDPRRRDNDVQSIAAIYRLRGVRTYKYFETCTALFVTTNKRLSYITRKYFEEEYKHSGKPVIVDDTYLTGLIWSKLNGTSEKLPTLKIMADALASQTIPSEFWNEVVQKVKQYEDENLITHMEYECFVEDLYTKRNIYDVIEDDVEKLNPGSVRDIVDMNYRSRYKEDVEEKERLQEENNLKSQQADDLTQQLIKEKADKYIRPRV